MSTLPLKCRSYLLRNNIQFDEVEYSGQKGVVLRHFPLSSSQLDSPHADILILLPGGYPDIAPDMFYAIPWLKLIGSNRYPRAADQSLNFAGKNWQRWSRHNTAWRAGVDGIWTMIKRIETALEMAA